MNEPPEGKESYFFPIEKDEQRRKYSGRIFLQLNKGFITLWSLLLVDGFELREKAFYVAQKVNLSIPKWLTLWRRSFRPG